jgi:hypothetical protein
LNAQFAWNGALTGWGTMLSPDAFLLVSVVVHPFIASLNQLNENAAST